MAGSNMNNNWERIQSGVRNTERLIRQKDYNSAMIKTRQTLEFMVRTLSGQTGSMNDSDLKEMIDSLYQGRQITKTSCDRYHKIRMIGNKAVHEGDTSASNANLAFQLLSQELDVFSNEYMNRRRSSPRTASRSSSSRSPSSRSSASRSPRNGRRRYQKRRRSRLTPYDLLKLLIPVVCILLIFFVVRLIKPKPEETESSSIPVSSEIPIETTEPIETIEPEPETDTDAEAPSVVYRTTDVLNVRSAPSAESDRLGKLNAGVTVEYIRTENEEWAVILYDGQEAYVASQYLTTQ